MNCRFVDFDQGFHEPWRAWGVALGVFVDTRSLPGQEGHFADVSYPTVRST